MRGLTQSFCLMLLLTAAWLSPATAATNETTTSAITSRVELPPGWDDLRDPLWPVGYTPPPPPPPPSATNKVVVVRQSEQELLAARAVWPSLELKALTKGTRGGYMAVIDGVGVVEAGEVVRIQSDGIIYRWRIAEIGPKGLKAKRMPLRAARQP